MLYVSHDRYFINKTATRILDLENRTLTNYLGNYDYYLEKKQQQTGQIAGTSAQSASLSGNAASQKDNPAAVSDSKQDWQSHKEQQASQRKKENAIKKCEERIEQLEKRLEELDVLMASADVCTNVAKLQELSAERAQSESELNDLYNKWEELSE